MRLAVLADVHANLPALEAVLKDVEAQGTLGIIVAGDFTGGPQSLEVTRLLRSLGAWMIRGNNEDYLVAYDQGGPDARPASRQWAAMDWAYRHMDREALDFIASLPEQRTVALPGAPPIRVVHGSPRGSAQLLLPDRDPAIADLFRRSELLPPGREPFQLSAVLAAIEEDVLVCAHSHIPWQESHDGRLALNPGSVGAPNNGDVRAQYALLTWQAGRWQASHRAVPYDLDRLRAAFAEGGLLAEGGAFARAVLLSMETGHNVAGSLVYYAHRYAAGAGFAGGPAIPDDLWEQAVASFDWQAAAAGTTKAMIRPCARSEADAILAIVNDAAQAYRGVIPADRWHAPYMAPAELQHEMDSGVTFWGYEEGELIGVMGIQSEGPCGHVQDVTLIRHAYVRTARRGQGIGGRLLSALRGQTDRPLLVGTWAAATWAIRFYEKHGFRRVSEAEKDRLLRKYWSIPERQVETSVVLADDRWWCLRTLCG